MLLEEVEKHILKFIWKFKGLRIAKTVLKKNEPGRLTFSISKFTTKLQYSKECGTGIKTDIQTSGIE